MCDTEGMRISADFTVIPDAYAKAAPPENRVDGTPVVSFPFFIDALRSEVRYLHWELSDADAIPACGFEWIHWSVANLPVEALMADFNDSHALAVPPDFSRALPAMVPEALQGRTSAASPWVGATNPAVTMRYNGPQPPDRDHEYCLSVWGSERPIEGLSQGFWLNAMLRALRCDDGVGVADYGGIALTGKA